MTGGPSLVLPGDDEDDTQLRWVGTPQYALLPPGSIASVPSKPGSRG